MSRVAAPGRGWLRRACLPAALLWACAAPPAGEPERLVRLGWTGSPDTLHPGRAMLAYAYDVLGLIYDSLYAIGPDGAVAPQAVAAALSSDDGLAWTFRIRTDLQFHDGVPLTARDVEFSLRLYMSRPDYPLLHAYTYAFERVDAVDDSTVSLRLREPVADLPSQLVFLYILPAHLWAADAAPRPEAASDVTLAPGIDDAAPDGGVTLAPGIDDAAPVVGSGPFHLVEFVAKSYVWLGVERGADDAPAIDGVLLQTFAHRDALVMALRSRQVDAILEMPFTALGDLRRRPGITVRTGISPRAEVANLILNQADPAACPPEGVCSGHPALRDVRVRRALDRALDRQQLIDTVLLGAGRPGVTLIPAALAPWFHDRLGGGPAQPAAAALDLDAAGYLDTDGDGVRQMPGGGQPLEFRLLWPSDSAFGARAADLVAAMWRPLGVVVRPRPVDPDALSAQCCPAFDYDVILWGWTTGPDPSFLLSAMLSDGVATGANESGFADAEFDSLYRAQARALDPERRQALVWRMQELVHEQAVYVVPFYPEATQAFHADRFVGWPAPGPRVDLAAREHLLALQPAGDGAP